MGIEERLSKTIKDVVDFPKPGIIFKDITPVLLDPSLTSDLLTLFASITQVINLMQ